MERAPRTDALRRTVRIAVVGPTSMTWDEIADDVEPDLARLRRPGVEVAYVLTGAGPRSITTDDDERAAAPHVVVTVERCAREGFDGVIIDCTGDPGLEQARLRVAIPVIGAGQAVGRASAHATPPLVVLSGDLLRASTQDELLEQVRRARTVALGGTGWSHLVPMLAGDGRVVLDPLDVALDECVSRIAANQPG